MIEEVFLIFIISSTLFLILIYLIEFIFYAIDNFSNGSEIAFAIALALAFSSWYAVMKYID